MPSVDMLDYVKPVMSRSMTARLVIALLTVIGLVLQFARGKEVSAPFASISSRDLLFAADNLFLANVVLVDISDRHIASIRLELAVGDLL